MNLADNEDLKKHILGKIEAQGIEIFTYALIEALNEIALSYSEHSKRRRLWLSLSSSILLSLYNLMAVPTEQSRIE